MDILCVDALIVDNNKPSKPTLDPLGKLHDVSQWFKLSNGRIRSKKIQDLNFLFSGDCLRDPKDNTYFKFTDEIRKKIESLLLYEDVAFFQSKHLIKIIDELVFVNGKFVRIFILPKGRYYFKVFLDDVEFMI